MKDKIYEILDNAFHLEDALEELERNGFKIIEKEMNEELENHSDVVSWFIDYEMYKDGKEFNVWIEGTALAEISYDSWVSSFNYSIEDYGIEEK